MNSQKFSDIVNEIIVKRGIKQKFLADQVGMSPVLLNSKLRGSSKWQIDQVMKVAKVLDISLDEMK